MKTGNSLLSCLASRRPWGFDQKRLGRTTLRLALLAVGAASVANQVSESTLPEGV
jgi:hypothetical protein